MVIPCPDAEQPVPGKTYLCSLEYSKEHNLFFAKTKEEVEPEEVALRKPWLLDHPELQTIEDQIYLFLRSDCKDQPGLKLENGILCFLSLKGSVMSARYYDQFNVMVLSPDKKGNIKSYNHNYDILAELNLYGFTKPLAHYFAPVNGVIIHQNKGGL